MSKILVATEKPFAKEAVDGIKKIIENEGHTFVLLEKYTEKSELIDNVSDATALIVRSDKVTQDVIEAGKELKIIVRAGAGYDNIDLEAATNKGIVVMNTPGQNSNAVAELAIGMMVYFARNKFNGKAGTELKGKTLGIHAFGNVGKLLAKIAKGFEMEVFAYDPFVDDEEMKNAGVIPLKNEEELYSKSQYVSLHIPANDKTKKSIGHQLLSKMPKNGVLVNTARKEVINEDDLMQVFKDRPDISYLSDIAPDIKDQMKEAFEDRVYFTPKKMGAQSKEANINAGLAAGNQIINFLKNNDTTFQVNK